MYISGRPPSTSCTRAIDVHLLGCHAQALAALEPLLPHGVPSVAGPAQAAAGLFQRASAIRMQLPAGSALETMVMLLILLADLALRSLCAPGDFRAHGEPQRRSRRPLSTEAVSVGGERSAGRSFGLRGVCVAVCAER